jgi:hypothetical protein
MHNKHTATANKRPTTPQRPPLNQMAPEEVRAWLRATRSALQQKMQRERAYLDRRAARGTSTPTDEAYERDQLLEADVLALLDEMEASLPGGKES